MHMEVFSYDEVRTRLFCCNHERDAIDRARLQAVNTLSCRLWCNAMNARELFVHNQSHLDEEDDFERQ